MSLQVWLPLNGSFENQGCSNINTLSYNNFTLQNNGKIGKCYSGYGIYHLSNEILNNEWSVSAWIKADSWYSSNNIIVCKNNKNGEVYQIYFSIIGGNQIRLAINNQSGILYNYTFNTGQWYHVAATYNGTTGTIYINGELKKSATVTNTYVSGMNNIGINCRSNNAAGTTHWVGSENIRYINDVRIYDHCLSAAEVKKLSQGLVLHYKLNEITQPNLLTGNVNDPSTWTLNQSTCVADDDALKVTITSNTGDRRIYRGVSNVWTPANSTFTVSFEARAITDGLTIDASRSNISGTDMVSFSLTTTWRHYSGQIINSAAATNGTLSIRCRTNGGIFWIKNVKLEHGPAESRFISSDESDNTIQDSSGYNHNGIIIGNPIIAIPSQRYSAYTSFNGTTDSIKADINFEIEKAQNFTFSAWIYSDRWNTGVNDYFLSSQESGGFLIRTLNNNNIRVRVNAFTAANFSTNSYIDADATLSAAGITTAEGWHFVAGVYTTSNLKLYVDGILCATKTITTYGLHFNSGTNLFLGAECAGANPSTFCKCGLSDVRIYYTALSADDILELYHTSMKIDNLGDILSFEVNENNQNKITKQGILNCSNISEITGLSFLKYDPNIYIEPDGSCWVRIFHHNNPAAALFSSTDDFEHSIYKDADRWFNVELCNQLTSWELLVRTKRTIDDTQAVFRWIQNVNPMIATASQVTADLVTYNTNGYNTRTFGGIYKRSTSDYTYLNTHDNAAGTHWYGAIGCYNVWNGGATGQISTGSANAITTGYIDLYVRIDNISNNSPLSVKSTKNNLWLTRRIIEV